MNGIVCVVVVKYVTRTREKAPAGVGVTGSDLTGLELMDERMRDSGCLTLDDERTVSRGLCSDDDVSTGHSGCSFGFKLTDEKLGRMTRDETRNLPADLVDDVVSREESTGVADGMTDSLVASLNTDFVLVLKRFKFPKGLRVTVTATFLREDEGSSCARLISMSTGGGEVGCSGTLTSVVTGGEVTGTSSAVIAVEDEAT